MKIGFIGVGNLGEKAVTKLSKDYDLFLSDPIEKDELKKVTNGYFSLEETINSSDVIFFTIKPNMIGELFSKNDFNLQDKTFISFMAGLSLDKIEKMKVIFNQIKNYVPILLIEHNMDVVISIADRISVLVNGKIIASGSSSEIKSNLDVRKAYLGTA